MKKPTVSVISVLYNQVEVTLAMLDSLRKQQHVHLEIILVDNASIEDTDVILEEYPEVQLIKSKTNLGFAGGNNLGIAQATGDYVFFLNNDTVVPNNTISGLVDTIEKHPDTGILCPLIYYYVQQDTLQYAGATAMNVITGRNRAIGHGEKEKPSNDVMETHFAHGAAMLIKKEVLDQVGPMPEEYFLYYEELDWSNRFKALGYKILVDKSQFILHKESMSTGKMSPLKTFYQTRNRLLFMRRNVNKLRFLLFFSFFVTCSLPANTLKFLVKKQTHLIAPLYRGFTSFITVA